ncbi:three-helix bundle dimerization domain-containing protein [Streptacidiphilus sp. PAMC 29251]
MSATVRAAGLGAGDSRYGKQRRAPVRSQEAAHAGRAAEGNGERACPGADAPTPRPGGAAGRGRPGPGRRPPHFDGSPVRTFVPILVERRVRTELDRRPGRHARKQPKDWAARSRAARGQWGIWSVSN